MLDDKINLERMDWPASIEPAPNQLSDFNLRGIAMSQAVQEILQRIEHLPAQDRLELDERLAQLSETEWKREAEEARRLAKLKGIDQAAIDKAVEQVRYAP